MKRTLLSPITNEKRFGDKYVIEPTENCTEWLRHNGNIITQCIWCLTLLYLANSLMNWPVFEVTILTDLSELSPPVKWSFAVEFLTNYTSSDIKN